MRRTISMFTLLATTGAGGLSEDERGVRDAVELYFKGQAMTLTALIVDDERLARVELRGLLVNHPEIEIAGEAQSADQAAALIAELRPDVVFLDVQMPGRSGFELLEEVDVPFRVVFVTAFDAHALRAFDVNALDYLLKPVNPARLAQTVARLVARPPEPSAEKPLALDDHLFLPGERAPRFVRVSAIACIRGADDYSEVILGESDSALVRRPLREWDARLPARFTRIHRTAIVNLDFVLRVERVSDDSLVVHLRGISTPVPLSRRHAARLKTF
jgi:two-component system LytT family response regulator